MEIKTFFLIESEKKIVELYNNGKPRSELVREYELTPSALSSWINKYNNSGSFKASSADYGTKINVILSNLDKYPISAMCKLLNISRSSLYYAKNKPAKKYNAEEEKLLNILKKYLKIVVITMDLEKSKLN